MGISGIETLVGVVSKEVRDKRFSLCEICEHKKIKGGMLICGQCGCLMKAKTKFTKTKCPIGKW